MDINKAVVMKNGTINAYRCPNCGTLFQVASRCPECGQKVESVAEHASKMEDRVELVRAMETVCRNLNDERVFMHWITMGVADEDITDDTTDEFIAEQYCEDEENFAELMDCFLECMKEAIKSGGLYCGRIKSNLGEEIE